MPGFEGQATTAVVSPWTAEGAGTVSVQVAAGTAHAGSNNGAISSTSAGWNALTQKIAVTPNTSYTLTVWVQNDFGNKVKGSVGVRAADGVTILAQSAVGGASGYVPLTVKFSSGNNSSVTIFTGFTGQKGTNTMRLDDVAVR